MIIMRTIILLMMISNPREARDGREARRPAKAEVPDGCRAAEAAGPRERSMWVKIYVCVCMYIHVYIYIYI